MTWKARAAQDNALARQGQQPPNVTTAPPSPVNAAQLPAICPCCGFDGAAGTCRACSGSARALDGRRELPPPRGDRWHHAFAGVREVPRAVLALLHGREFLGALRLPVAMNGIAFTLLVLGGWQLLAPAFAATFAASWGWFDGLRTAAGDSGPMRWLMTTWLLLGPPLLDLVAGAAQEPLRDATERRMLGEPRGDAAARGLLRLRERARVFALLLLVWPFALALVLVPWLGLPLVLALGSAVAAVVWFEAPMAARGWPLTVRLRSLWRNRWRALGTGCGVQVAAAVPFVNVLALAPVATIAATASYLQFDKRVTAAASA
jgi:hypothetical protein